MRVNLFSVFAIKFQCQSFKNANLKPGYTFNSKHILLPFSTLFHFLLILCLFLVTEHFLIQLPTFLTEILNILPKLIKGIMTSPIHDAWYANLIWFYLWKIFPD